MTTATGTTRYLLSSCRSARDARAECFGIPQSPNTPSPQLVANGTHHRVPASGGNDALGITLPAQGEFIISHKPLTSRKVILALIQLGHYGFIC